MDASLPTLGYWNIRGLAQHIRFQLAYLGVKFNDKQYTGAKSGADHPAQEWLNEKFNLGLAFPNLPYFIETDGYTITESTAIPVYIADKYGP